MNIEDIRSKTDSELEYELNEAKKELFGLRLKASTESLANSSQIRQLRRQEGAVPLDQTHREALQVPAISSQGVRARPTLSAQMGFEAVQELLHHRS